MNIKARLEKLEAATGGNGYTIIYVNDGETLDEALRRHYPDDAAQPKNIVYLDEWDKLI